MPSGLREALNGARSGDVDKADKQALVDWVFTRVADRYDLGNDIMSAGWHTRWKRELLERIAPEPGWKAADIACGTGDITWMLAERGVEVTGCDINPDMMRPAAAKRPPSVTAEVPFVVADAADLPFDDASLDLVTCVYAGRGFPDFPAVVREVHRVLKPGGHFWNLDFARPSSRTFDKLYRGYMLASGAILGTVLHGHPKTYMYIPVSMKGYPGQRWLDHLLKRQGFDTELDETFAQLMAYNHGTKR